MRLIYFVLSCPKQNLARYRITHKLVCVVNLLFGTVCAPLLLCHYPVFCTIDLQCKLINLDSSYDTLCQQCSVRDVDDELCVRIFILCKNLKSTRECTSVHKIIFFQMTVGLVRIAPFIGVFNWDSLIICRYRTNYIYIFLEKKEKGQLHNKPNQLPTN